MPITEGINSKAAELRQWSYQEAINLLSRTTPPDAVRPTDPRLLFQMTTQLAEEVLTWVTQDPR